MFRRTRAAASSGSFEPERFEEFVAWCQRQGVLVGVADVEHDVVGFLAHADVRVVLDGVDRFPVAVLHRLGEVVLLALREVCLPDSFLLVLVPAEELG